MTDEDFARLALGAAGRSENVLESAHGWSNLAWVGSTAVVRVSSGRLEGSFAHEARMLAGLAGRGIPIAPVIAHGTNSELEPGRSGEWIVTQRIAGLTMARAWRDLSPKARRMTCQSLASHMKQLHEIKDDLGEPFWWTRAHEPGWRRDAYHPRPDIWPGLIDDVRRLPGADESLLDDAAAFVSARAGAIATDREVLLHCDLHGHNVLVDDNKVSALLDWEGSHRGPISIELDMLLRYWANAHNFPSGPTTSSNVQPGDGLEAVHLIADAYPALFEGARLRDRLEFHDACWNLQALLVQHHFEPDTAIDWPRLRTVLNRTSHLTAYADLLA